MALGDPLGLQDDPEKAAQEIPDYLGKESPLAFKGQPALPVTGAAAFGSPSAPTGPGGPAPMPDGMTSQMQGGTQGGFAQLASKLMDSDMFKLGGGGDLGTRGDTGGISLSDHLRDLESGAPNPSSSFPIGDPSSQVSGGELALGAEAGGAAAKVGGDLAAGGADGLLEAFQSGGFEGLLDNMNFGGVDPLSGWAMTGLIKSLWDPDNAFSLPFSGGNRGESVAHEIHTQMKDLPEIMRQLKAGAADPTTLRGMNDQDLAGLFSQARTAYGSTSGLAPMFGESGRKEAGQQHLDMSSLADPIRKMEELDFFNMIAAQDLLDQRGHQWGGGPDSEGYDPGNERLDFGGAIHALTGQGGLQQYGNEQLTALAPWDPYYKGHGLVDEQVWDQNAAGGQYVTQQRSVDDPAGYLSAIGADPKLAETLGPHIEGAQPGKYLETLNQIFGLLNPNAGDSTFGRLYATQQGDPGATGDVASASGSGGFGDVAGAIFAPGQPAPFDPSDAGQAGLAGGEEFAEEQLTT